MNMLFHFHKWLFVYSDGNYDYFRCCKDNCRKKKKVQLKFSQGEDE